MRKFGKKGEGIMLKHPNSKYEDKRSSKLLKYKPVSDEAKIIGHKKEKENMKESWCFWMLPLVNKGKYQVVNTDKSLNLLFLNGWQY